MFKPKLSKKDQGFTLVEVLVAILIATIFITVAMQMMAIAAVFKVRAQEFAEATTWIQEDLENIKYQAANYQYTLLVDETDLSNGDINTNHESTDTILHVASVDGFQAGDTLLIGNASISKTIAVGGVNTTNKTITLTNELSASLPKDTVLVATTRCSPKSTTDPRFDDGLRDWISDTNHADGITDIPIASNSNDLDNSLNNGNPLHSKVFTKKTFRFRRTTTLYATSPYNVLQIKYAVSPISGVTVNPPIATFNTEVIPNAALQCP